MQVEHGTPGDPRGRGGPGPASAPEVVTADAAPQDVRVVAVDTRSERRGVTRQLLERSFKPSEIAEADSRAMAVELVGRCHPAVVVVEIQMPVAEGLGTIAEIGRMSPRPRIVVCSFRRDAATIQDALDHGADHYLTKPASSADLCAALGPAPAGHASRHRPPTERPVSPPPPAAIPVPAGTIRPASGHSLSAGG